MIPSLKDEILTVSVQEDTVQAKNATIVVPRFSFGSTRQDHHNLPKYHTQTPDRVGDMGSLPSESNEVDEMLIARRNIEGHI